MNADTDQAQEGAAYAAEVITLADMDAWREFATANEESLIEEYGSVERALKAACDGGLMIGGGAAPMFHVVFAE